MKFSQRLQPDIPWQEQDFGIARRPKSVCVTRYGGFGDMIQAASILPHLKRAGYHVTVNTTPKGQDILEDDPNVDAFFLQDDEQVPNRELGDYWKKLAAHYDRHIQLSESVEGRLLAIAGRPDFDLSHEERHAKLNRNYMEEIHEIAGVPLNGFAPLSFFYPSGKERHQAKEFRRQHTPGPLIMVSLSGSSVHKSYPHMDTVIKTLLAGYPTATVLLVGDGLCQILEVGWEDEKRVICASGKWGIRRTLSFAQECDLVIGPETGVLNAVSMSRVPKVVLLSHSSVENLTKHWRNTVSLTPTQTPCYPCHQMHYGFTYCHRDDATGAALCAANIHPHWVVQAARTLLSEGSREHLLAVV